MTLVVAAIHDDDQVTIASDTLITWDDQTRRSPDQYSFAKLVILRPDVAVGVTGADPHGRVRDLLAMRDESIEAILNQLADDPVAGFVVAALRPARLWEVFEGSIRDRTSAGMAWDGDPDARKVFEHRWVSDWKGTQLESDIPFRLMTALQALTSFPRVPTVGGITLRVHGGGEGFHFVPDRGRVLPGPEWVIFVGWGATPGALGILDLASGIGQLFTQEAPDDPIVVEARNVGAFLNFAQDQNQSLRYSP
jgi:hypothetical protein